MDFTFNMPGSHLYSVLLAPRGYARMAQQGMYIAQQYLSPLDKIIGLVGEAGSGKSVLIKGMFPGLELTNDDEGVNMRPLPLLDISDDGFYSAHTYHVDIRFEAAFTQMHVLADAIKEAVDKGKRVVVEHFDLIYPFLGMNANLLIGIGGEIIVTRPTLFGPEPQDIHELVYKTHNERLMAHSAEDVTEFFMKEYYTKSYKHADVRRGFILMFHELPSFSIAALERKVLECIDKNISISYRDENCIQIGEEVHRCTSPRMHVKSTGEIEKFKLLPEFIEDPHTGQYLLVGLVGGARYDRVSDLNALNY